MPWGNSRRERNKANPILTVGETSTNVADLCLQGAKRKGITTRKKKKYTEWFRCKEHDMCKVKADALNST